MYSLQSRHFLTLTEQWAHTVTCPHGTKRMSLTWSEQTMHSSKEGPSSPPPPPEDAPEAPTPATPATAPPCPIKLFRFSFWQLVRALQRLGSGHRSKGVCPFLFLTPRLAPLAARKHAIDADDFLSERKKGQCQRVSNPIQYRVSHLSG